MAEDLPPWEEAKKGAKAPADLSPWEEAAAKGHGSFADTAKDVGKGVVSGAGTGALSVPGFLGDTVNLLARGSKAAGDYIGGKLGAAPSPELGPNLLPTTQGLQSDVEKVTGPFYQPHTTAGKIAHTAASVAPAIALGGETLPGVIAKSIGSGALSEGGGAAGDALKGYLPQSVAPYAEPVGRAAGAVAGAFTPAGARRAVTPNPMSDQQLATVRALGDFPMTAGQATESPRLMAMEAHSPRMQGVAGQQEQAFTGRVMGEAGIPSNNFQDIGQGDAVGQRLGSLYRSGAIDAPNFNQLLRTIGTERRDVQRVAGIGNTPQIDAVRDMTRSGAMNNGQPVLNMPGGRYEFMRGELQRRAEAAGNPQEARAIHNIREAMDNAFNTSTGLGPQITPLQQQYANWNVLKNIRPEVGKTTVTPQEVKSAVGRNWGNAAANTGRGSLAPLADDASRVMTPLPKPSTDVPDWVHLAGAAAGALSHGAAGAHYGGGMGALAGAGEGALSGLFTVPHLYNMGKNVVGRAVGSAPAQAYLGNQVWRPGPHTTGNADLLAKMLLTPPVNQQSGQ